MATRRTDIVFFFMNRLSTNKTSCLLRFKQSVFPCSRLLYRRDHEHGFESGPNRFPSSPRRSIGPSQREPWAAQDDGRPYIRFTQNAPPLYTTRRWLWVSVGGISIVFGVYYYTHLETVPISGRRRFMNISASTEKSLSAQAYEQFLDPVRRRILRFDHPTTRQVQAVVDRLLNAVPVLFEDSHKLITRSECVVHVIDDPKTANALVLPGGQIFVFTGILPVAANTDGLAVLLSHEISHKLLKHHMERMSLASILLAFSGMFQFLTGISGPLNELLLNFGVLLPHSRATEAEADHVGLLLMAAACYEPGESIEFWKRMKQADKGGGRGSLTEWLSTHPSHSSRSQLLTQWQDEARGYREKVGCDERVRPFWRHFSTFA